MPDSKPRPQDVHQCSNICFALPDAIQARGIPQGRNARALSGGMAEKRARDRRKKMGLLNWLGSLPDSVLIFRRMCAMSKARFDIWPSGQERTAKVGFSILDVHVCA